MTEDESTRWIRPLVSISFCIVFLAMTKKGACPPAIAEVLELDHPVEGINDPRIEGNEMAVVHRRPHTGGDSVRIVTGGAGNIFTKNMLPVLSEAGLHLAEENISTMAFVAKRVDLRTLDHRIVGFVPTAQEVAVVASVGTRASPLIGRIGCVAVRAIDLAGFGPREEQGRNIRIATGLSHRMK